MDQEVYDEVLSRLADMEDQHGAMEFALLLAFHYPGQGRLVLGLPQALQLPEPDPTSPWGDGVPEIPVEEDGSDDEEPEKPDEPEEGDDVL